MQIEDKSLEGAKRRFLLSLVFLAVGVLYAFWPIDIIPDFMGPLGWIDDLTALGGAAAWAAVNYMRLKKADSSSE